MQRFLVEQIAQAEWRLTRIATMEADIFHRGIAAERSAGAVFESDCAGSNWLMKLLRYEIRRLLPLRAKDEITIQSQLRRSASAT